MVNIDIDTEKCIGCGACVNACPVSIYDIIDRKSKVVGDTDKCVVCRACETICPVGAVVVKEE